LKTTKLSRVDQQLGINKNENKFNFWINKTSRTFNTPEDK
jgi:hypothetical protein